MAEASSSSSRGTAQPLAANNHTEAHITPAEMVSTVTAQPGGSVNAPTFQASVFHGPVTMNFNSSKTAQTSPTSNTNIDQIEDSASDQVLTGDEENHSMKKRLKNSFIAKFEKLYEGTAEEGDHVFLNDIFTELYVIEGRTGGVYNQHEVRQVETFNPRTDETPIQFSDIFKVQSGEIKNGTKVLTVGIAGVGKTVSVHKFILDWAEEKSNQDIDLIFFLPFRELNLIKDEHYTLRELILYFHRELCDLKENEMFSGKCRVAIILDGLDESRIPLDFDQKKLSNVTDKTPIDKLITNLIKGELLPSALIWITSRPAAVNQIPRRYFDPITEIRGFTDQQKEEYIRKRIKDQDKASRIISHIKSSRSLHILCHIPVFCWIATSVLLQMLTDSKDMEHAPTTLTEMYTRFLLFQTTQMTEKYQRMTNKQEFSTYQRNRVVPLDILKLAKLAFLQLEKGQLIFYESDLKDCNIDVDQALVYSGVCTQIFRKDEMVFSFVHLSFQEFLAALYVFLTFSSNWNPFLPNFLEKIKWMLKHNLVDLHKTAVNEAVQSENGHLDLFLRFLLGLSLQSNQRLLKSLKPQLKIREENLKETTDYIKRKIRESKSSERCINLFHCLSELKDDSLMATVQNYLSSGDLSRQSLSSAQWSALVFVLLMSEETQETFELKKYAISDEALMRLLAVVKHTRQALLDHCHLSIESCRVLPTVLSSSIPLRELDLSNNDLQDSAMNILSDGLKDSCCKLEILRLRCCNLTRKCCENLASALSSDSSALKELDLSYNELKDRGVKLLSTALEKPHCKLEILRLSLCVVTVKGCSALASALKSNPSHLRELDLSYNYPGESGEKMLFDLRDDPHCKLEKISVDHGGKIRISPGPRKYACELTLDPNTAHKNISLSEDCRRVERVMEDQMYPEHPERFESQRHAQVLCRESLTGRCYWEAEWEEWGEIAVAYKEIERKEKNKDDSYGFGSSLKSWSLICTQYGYSFTHNKQSTETRIATSKRVGVYLDWPAGYLAFYSINGQNELTDIHSFRCVLPFTEPLYAGFGVYYEMGAYVSSVSLCPIEETEISQ
ncbi:NACHT, LRR and PYD domains-containing protein 3-like [Colossoma macropomum]|uniref:NACHT, LRR and PYD domains-containing protein 3-like n=1 Tax=Colossoma macropomum TaxID=42526 RepID=UPI0018650ED3|nr:NACHT, LRR and PYD domains-containing protein 3-like [Colossoma macropomum]